MADIELGLTTAEARILVEIFRGHLAGNSLYAQGNPLNDLYNKVVALEPEVGQSECLVNENPIGATVRRELRNGRVSNAPLFDSKYALLRYIGDQD